MSLVKKAAYKQAGPTDNLPDVDETFRRVQSGYITLRQKLDGLDRIGDRLPVIPETILTALRGLAASIKLLGKELHHIDKAERKERKRRREAEPDSKSAPTKPKAHAGKRDWLDGQGVDLWNVGLEMDTLIPNYASTETAVKEEVEAYRRSLGVVRYLSWALMAAGTDSKPDSYFTFRNLHVSAKTAATLFEVGNTFDSQEVLSEAAKYYENLKDAQVKVEGKSDREKALVQIEYLLARLDIDMQRCNFEYAWTLFRQASHLIRDDFKMRDIHVMSIKALQAGRQILVLPTENSDQSVTEASAHDKAVGRKAETAINWFRSGLAILEPYETSPGPVVEWKRTKVALMQGLAQASVAASSLERSYLDRADGIIRQLVEDEDLQAEDQSQNLRYTMILVLKMREAEAPDVSAVFKEIVKNVSITEFNVNKLIGEAKSLTAEKYASLPGRILVDFLQVLVRNSGDEIWALAHRVLLALLLHLQSRVGSEPFICLKLAEEAMNAIHRSDAGGLNAGQAMACTTVIWKLADWLSDQEDLKFVEASARWFSLAAHSALSEMTASEVEKCKRRAALGYIKAAKFDEAEDTLETCDMKSAETRYLQFLIALRQERLPQACDALRAMGACEDLDGTHLLMTVQAANEASKVTVVARALATLLETLERTGMREKGVEELTLVRCLIKMSLNQLKEEVVGTEIYAELLVYFQRGLRFAEEIRARDELATKYKEIAWLYKTAYNTSFEAVKVWEDKVRLVSMLDTSAELMECYKSIPMQELDPKFQLQLATVRYFGLCVTVFASREIVNAEEKNAILQRAKSRIPECLAILETVQPTQDLDQKLCVNMVSTLHIFSCEIMVELEDWEAISMMAKKMQPGALSMETLQGMASLILTVKTPLEVADKVTREILRVVLSPTYGDNMAQQSRWMRATVDMLLHRGRTLDYDDALDYVQQAKGCMERGGKTYPSEEVDWLWRTCYNLSLDLADLGDKARCQKWMEMSLALCTHAVNGDSTKAELYRCYERLLLRLS